MKAWMFLCVGRDQVKAESPLLPLWVRVELPITGSFTRSMITIEAPLLDSTRKVCLSTRANRRDDSNLVTCLDHDIGFLRRVFTVLIGHIDVIEVDSHKARG